MGSFEVASMDIVQLILTSLVNVRRHTSSVDVGLAGTQFERYLCFHCELAMRDCSRVF
jgi:hypothetical protein